MSGGHLKNNYNNGNIQENFVSLLNDAEEVASKLDVPQILQRLELGNP